MQTRFVGGLLVLAASSILVAGSTRALEGRNEARSGVARAPRALVATEDATLAPGGVPTMEQAGAAVAADANFAWVLVGRPTASVGSSGGGAVTAFEWTGSSFAERGTLPLVPDRGGDDFGRAVAASEDASAVVVGAPGEDQNGDAGGVYVFRRAGTVWTGPPTIPRIAPPAPVNGGRFGEAVAIAGDGSRILVGAPAEIDGGRPGGAAYVFVASGTTWALEDTFLDPTDAPAIRFGAAVALSRTGDVAFVGAPNADGTGTDAGRVVVFRRTGSRWGGGSAIEGGAVGGRFGSAVAVSLDGTRLVAGAPRESESGRANAGAVHVYVASGSAWTADARLVAPSPTVGDELGRSVSISADGSRIVAGAPLADTSAGTDAGIAVAFARSGTSWSAGTTFTASGAAPDDAFGASVVLAGDGGRAIVGVPGDARGAVAGAGTARVFSVRAGTGDACATTAECAAGTCVDGVCCTTPCAGGTSDCQACSVAAGGTVDGTCTALSAAAAPTVECRAAAPPVALGPSGVPATSCDVAEHCVAGSTSCPPDGFAAAATPCRGLGAGGCDAAESCTGASPDCPTDVASAVVTCRASAGECDVAEMCDGDGFTCPGDVRLSAGTSCRDSSGPCDLPEVCDGSAVCPIDTFRALGFVCAPASGDCDVEDTCSGTSAECATRVAATGTPCRAAGPDVCDAADTCDGASTICPDLFLSGVECRASAGGCDSPETCSGTSATCPGDEVEAVGMVCRAATAACDVAEACDGTSAACPVDVTSCADGGGVSDAGARDAGLAAPDAGTPVVATSGCGCRAGSARAVGGWIALVLLAIVVRVRRRAS